MIEKSTIVCPYCGFQKEETLPITYCLLIWKCPSCNKVVQPKKNDCCVFCSYGSIPCTSKQELTG